MNSFSQIYSAKVLEHVRHPQNMGEIKNADAIATVGNRRCGDVMRLYLKVKSKSEKSKSEEYIGDIKFQTLGCGAAIATSSIITTMVKGKPLAEAEKITDQAIVEALGGLPATKTHCSLLAADALKKAIKFYKSKRGS